MLRLSSQPLDDDELSRRTQIAPRQTVNQICRALQKDGKLQRIQGRDGKIVNLLTAPSAPPTTSASVASPHQQSPTTPGAPPLTAVILRDDPPPGSSAEQRAAERTMLDLLAARLGVRLDPARLTVPSGARVEIDGTDQARSVLVECWAHQGKPTAQKHKVLTDALKLTWIATTLDPPPRLILCMSDPLAAAPFLPASRSWAAQALTDLAVAIEVVELPPEVREGIAAAQHRQYR